MGEGKKLVALRPMRYERRDMVAGEVFVAATVDASYFMRTGRAEPAPQDEPPRSPTRAVQPATTNEVENEPAQTRRRYVRRSSVLPVSTDEGVDG